MLQFHDWLIFGLSGEFVGEPSSAAMSQFVDVRGRTWADELLAALGLDRGLFPPMADAGARAGGLLPAVARETGLLAGTPVHVGGGDSHTSALGAGGVHPAGITGVLYTWLRNLAAPLAGDSQAGAGSYAAIDELAASSPLGARDLLVACGNPFWGENASATPYAGTSTRSRQASLARPGASSSPAALAGAPSPRRCFPTCSVDRCW